MISDLPARYSHRSLVVNDDGVVDYTTLNTTALQALWLGTKIYATNGTLSRCQKATSPRRRAAS